MHASSTDSDAVRFAEEGHIIDERVVVECVGAGPAGDAVTILSEMPGLTGRAMYDVEIGMLVAIARTEHSSGITTELALDALP